MTTYVHGAGVITQRQARIAALNAEAAALEAEARERVATARAAISDAERRIARAGDRRDRRLTEINAQIEAAAARAKTDIEERIAAIEHESAERLIKLRSAAQNAEYALEARRAAADAARARARRRRRKYEKQAADIETLIRNMGPRTTDLPAIHGGPAGLAAAVREIQRHGKDKASNG